MFKWLKKLLTQSLPFKGGKTYYDVMIHNACKNNDIIYFLLASGNFGLSGSRWVKRIRTRMHFHPYEKCMLKVKVHMQCHIFVVKKI